MDMVNYIPIKQKDGYITKLAYHAASNEPSASILILHGLAEHKKRYTGFAKYLSKLGYDVYIYNHRGHGTDKKLHELGFICPKKGYNILIDDAANVSDYIVNNNRCRKLILFGHSMGSLIARNLLTTFDKYDGVILSGTTNPPKFTIRIGLFISSIIKLFKKAKHRSPYMHNMIFGSKKYIKLSERTAFDWLSRSYPVVGEYFNDPYCGFICTVSLYNDLLRLAYNASKYSNIRLIKKDLPIYIISGEKDPVGNYGKEIKKLLLIMKKLEFTRVDSKLYTNCRHELLNELNKDLVYSDIKAWIGKL